MINSGASSEGSREPLRILIAEDDLLNQRMLTLQLEGHQIGATATAAGAIAQILSADWDVVLVDLRLPDGTGAEVAQTVRSLPPPTGTTLLIGLTASSSREEHRAGVKAGLNICLMKPFEARQLLNFLRKAAPDLAERFLHHWRKAPAESAFTAAQTSRLGHGEAPPDDLAPKAPWRLMSTAIGPDAWKEAVQIFSEDSSGCLHQLRNALERPAFAAAMALAHKLAGQAAALRLDHLKTLARALEAASKTRELEPCIELLRALEVKVKEIVNAMKASVPKG